VLAGHHVGTLVVHRPTGLTVEQLAIVGEGVLGEGDDVRIAVALCGDEPVIDLVILRPDGFAEPG